MQTGTHQQLHNAERQITGETYVKRLSGYYEFVYREEKMRADKIKTIIGNINDLPYKTILFDGTWGVGKSYAVNEALAGNPDVCKISMFGMTDARQIYHEVLFQLALKNNVGGKIGEIANNIIEGAAKVWDKVGQARDVVQNIANERELFLLLSKEFTFLHIVVIDDLERMNSNMNLEEIFGIIEELKQCNYVKVILVANTAEMSKDKKEIFDKYSEKVIERTYAITERAESVECGGYVTLRAGQPQDANAILIPKQNADEAMDCASCIGCGACVAACKNGSAMLFVSSKVSQLALLPQGRPEAARRAKAMIAKMDELGFGNCTNTRACEAVCPKNESIANIARLNREFIKAKLND